MLSKRLLNLSTKYRKLFSASTSNAVGSLCQVNGFKDHPKLLSSHQYDSSKNRYKLVEHTNPSVVVDLLEFNFNNPNLSSSDTIRVLSQLSQLCKQEVCSPEELVYENFFVNLCDLIKLQADNYTLSEVVILIKLLKKMKSLNSSKTISHLLQCIEKFVDTASLEDYNDIIYLVSKAPNSALAQQLKTNLRKKFLLKITTEFDEKNFDFLVQAFRFACFESQDKEIVKIIVNALNNCDFETQSSNNLQLLMKILCTTRHYSTEYNEILLKTQNAIVANIAQFENNIISIILNSSSKRDKYGSLTQFYNKDLFDKAVEKLIASDCTLHEAVDCLKALLATRHTNKELLDYLSGKVYVEKEIDKNSINNYVLFLMLEGFANLKYKPIWWEIFLRNFKSIDTSYYTWETLLYRVYHLACLDCYEPELLKSIFKKKPDFKRNTRTHHTFLQLYQKLKTAPNYTGPQPSQVQVQSLQSLIRTIADYPLYTSLKEALGGSEFVKSNIRTKLFHQIDHVIAIEADGTPHQISNIKNQNNTEISARIPIEYLEDFIIPENCQLIAIVRWPNDWYARNTKQMLGTYATYIETLESLSCHVVTISDSEWQSLPKETRTGLLMDLIKSKLNDKQQIIQSTN